MKLRALFFADHNSLVKLDLLEINLAQGQEEPVPDITAVSARISTILDPRDYRI